MHSICNLNYSIPKKTPIAFHNRSNYDYNFIMKELAKEFPFLEESTEKYITFTVSIKKEDKRIDKNGEEFTKNISHILQFIDTARFMASSVIFLNKFIKLNLNMETIIEKVKLLELNISITTAFLNTQILKMI